ncbi:MAG: hypothetical protein ACI81R_003060 [Bradymonadia bacterium]
MADAVLDDSARENVATCLLARSERSDGALLGELMAGASAPGVMRIAEVLPSGYDAGVHANSFAASLARSTQEALGQRIMSLSASAQDLIVSIALEYGLDPLSDYCGPFVRNYGSDDSELANYARQQLDDDNDASETVRWAAATSGVWDAGDLINCYRGDEVGCESWSGQSPLAVMAEADVEGSDGAAQVAVELVRGAQLEHDEVTGLTRFLSSASYTQSGAFINVLMLDMTNPGIDDGYRSAMARGASERMCAMGVVLETMMRARSDEGILDDASKPWPVFINHCLETYWTGFELGPAVASGSMFGAPRALYERVVMQYAEAVSSLTCEELSALADDAVERVGNRAWQRGLAYPATATAAGGRCDDTFMDAIVSLSQDNLAHPEARLSAISWRIDQGDTSACSEVVPAMQWYDEELREGPSAWSERDAAALSSSCSR